MCRPGPRQASGHMRESWGTHNLSCPEAPTATAHPFGSTVNGFGEVCWVRRKSGEDSVVPAAIASRNLGLKTILWDSGLYLRRAACAGII